MSQEEKVIGGEQIVEHLSDAVAEWNKQPAGKVGVITIMDSRTYTEGLTGSNTIKIPEDSQLLITAADWPVIEDADAPIPRFRQVGQQRRGGVPACWETSTWKAQRMRKASTTANWS